MKDILTQEIDEVVCPQCEGSGKVFIDSGEDLSLVDCPNCGGSGLI